jgi:hypothetical protein
MDMLPHVLWTLLAHTKASEVGHSETEFYRSEEAKIVGKPADPLANSREFGALDVKSYDSRRDLFLYPLFQAIVFWFI